MSLCSDVFEMYKSRRRTVKLDERASAYSKLRTSTELQYFREDFGGVTTVRYAADGERVAVGFNSGDLQVVRPGSLGQKASVEVVLRGWEGNHSMTCVRFHPRHPDSLYAASTEGTICRRHLSDASANCEDLVIIETCNEINSFDFDANSSTIVTGGKDSAVRVYDAFTLKPIVEYSRLRRSAFNNLCPSNWENLHEKRVYCVRYLPQDPHVIVSGGWDRTVKVWDTRVPGGWVRDIVGPYICGESIDFSKGTLLTGSCITSNSLELWDFGSGRLLKRIVPTNKKVYLYGEFPYAVQFYKGDVSGDLVLSGGSGLGGLQVISIRENRILYLFEDEKPVIAVDSIGSSITFGGKSNSLLFANVSMTEEIFDNH